jgi:hypothetical protein
MIEMNSQPSAATKQSLDHSARAPDRGEPPLYRCYRAG